MLFQVKTKYILNYSNSLKDFLSNFKALNLIMSSCLECPICMDDININKNCITTECGHCFHTSCVMRNVAQNGFACPMCRSAMAEYADAESEDGEYEEDREDGEFSMLDERNPDDYALRGFRFFMDNVEGVAHGREDELEEQEEMEEAAKPSVAYIAQKLQEQGTTMEDLVKILLRDHDEYDTEDEEFDRVDERVWGEMRILIDNFQTQEVEAPATPVVEEPIHPNVTIRQRIPAPAPETPTQVTTLAEDKPRQRRHLNLESVSRVLFPTDAMEE
jgi:hypothetical protein